MSYSKGIRSIRSIAAATLSAAMIFAAAACGTTDTGGNSASGNDSKDSGSSTTQGFDTSSIKKDDAIASLLPDSVAGDGTLTVGTDTSYAPAEFLAEDGKTAVGFDVDLSKALAAVFGLKETTVSSTFDSIIPSVGSKYDIGISSFTVTPERMEAVDFVTYFKAGSTWVVRKGNPDKVDTANLCGVKVAVQTGTTQEEEVNKANEQCKADGKDAIDIQSSKLQTDVTTAVASGKASIFYADSPVAGYAISQTGDTLETLGDDTGVTPEAVAIKKGDSATAEAVQKAIQKLMDDGTYGKILDAWGVKSGAIDKAEINPTV
ncbi:MULTISPECIES: ABC transporter substrate-binding protein [Bifidobacterium]|uniref:ABC transporter substrate-binding protein n=1 Tax=Bifidobacterium TaxID=1678 RepID=UPI001BDD2E86|nr:MULTISPECIES: ABC transporter substrate-binding protein [Bifidobacterium]MBT1162047.1 ABC transporter substrate-binding protein [Bifidobacterium sp. SO1]MBW3078039.1 ABC transporter substrate-binding protein [Bifidobacterium simiiventris]